MIFNTNYLRGAVKIRISGSMPERFINLCINEEILLWGLTKNDDDLTAWIGLEDFFRIRPLVLRSRSRIRVITRCGFPFVMKRLKRRKIMVAGPAIFVILLYILSTYIWFVDITGLKSLPEETVRQLVYERGLKPGAEKDTINFKAIEKEILLNVPEVAWVGINFTGTRAVIEVVEKTIPKQESKSPAHIVAAKDGVITEIIALAGQASVKSGDTVKKGDILIKGFLPEPPPPTVERQPPIISVPQELTRAKGIIKARVWYESYAEADLKQTSVNRTGNKEMAVALKIGNAEVALKTAPTHPYREFETEVIHKQLALWRNSDFTVESNITVFHEVNTSEIERSFEEARDEAHNKAIQVVQNVIPESAQILARNYEILKTPEDNIVRIRVNVETIEDIGETIVISQ